MWVLYELTANQKNCRHFKVLSLYSTQKQWTISWSDYDMQWKVYFIWQLTSPVVGLRWPALWLDWEEAPKHFPKPTLHQKKIMVTVWWSAARLTCDSFWISVKLLYLGSMLSELMRCTENWNACSLHQSTKRAQFFSMTMPDGTSHNQCFESRMSQAAKFCLTCHIHLTSCQPTTTSSSISTTFLQRKCFHNQQEAENAFQEFVESWSTDFYATEINNLISHWQKCVDCVR